MKNNSEVKLLNPQGLFINPVFSQVAVINGSNKTVYVGGQNALDGNGDLVGKSDFAGQTKQVLVNVKTALAAGGANFSDVIKWTLFVKEGQSLELGLKTFQRMVGQPAKPPLLSVIFVAGLANPDYLLEMEAIAVIQQ